MQRTQRNSVSRVCTQLHPYPMHTKFSQCHKKERNNKECICEKMIKEFQIRKVLLLTLWAKHKSLSSSMNLIKIALVHNGSTNSILLIHYPLSSNLLISFRSFCCQFPVPLISSVHSQQ